MIPADSPQTSSAPISSLAQLSGSRRKNDRPIIRLFTRLTTVFETPNIHPATLLKARRLVKDWQCHLAFHGFAVAKRGNKLGILEIGQSGIAKSDKRRFF